MTFDDSTSLSNGADDFARWFFGGSPPADDGWERNAFEAALHRTSAVVETGRLPVVQQTLDRVAATETFDCQAMSVA